MLINRKQERGVRKRQTTTRHAMTSMCVGATACPLVLRLCLGSPCRSGPNPPARMHKDVSLGSFGVSYKVTTPSKRPGLNKRPFYDFPSKSNWKFKAHTERTSGWKVQNHMERGREKGRDRENTEGGEKPQRGFSITPEKPFPTCCLISPALQLQHEVIICMRSPISLLKH